MSDQARSATAARISACLVAMALAVAARPAAVIAAAGPPAAPPLELEVVLAGPERIDLESLSGNAVVIDFWATWCAPCVAAIPHWNELVDAFAGEPVRFLSVSDEDRDTVAGFLEERPIAGWLALDTDRSTFEGYRVESLPHVALIDPEGRLRGVAFPEDLTAATIRDVMASRTPDLPERTSMEEAFMARLDAAFRPRAVFEARIEPSAGSDFLVSQGPGTFLALSAPPERALRMALEVPKSRIVYETDLPDELYDFAFKTGSAELLRTILQPAIAEAFDVEIAREGRLTDVWVLRAPAAGGLRLAASSAASLFVRSTPSSAEYTGATVGEIAQALENRLGRPVVDESGLAGRYDLVLEEAEPDELRAGLALETGLRLDAGRREVEMVVVRGRRP